MYRQSRELGFPMMAGSSVPVTWRRPPLAFRKGISLEGRWRRLRRTRSLRVPHAGIAPGLRRAARRRDRAPVVQCLEGKAAWEAARAGLWRADLLRPRSRHVPGGLAEGRGGLRRADPEAAVFLVEYADGFRRRLTVARLVAEFAFAAPVAGRSEPVGTWCELNKPQRDHFSFLCNHIEVMFRPAGPVTRSRGPLVTGVLAALMDSRAAGGAASRRPTWPR